MRADVFGSGLRAMVEFRGEILGTVDCQRQSFEKACDGPCAARGELVMSSGHDPLSDLATFDVPVRGDPGDQGWVHSTWLGTTEVHERARELLQADAGALCGH